MPLKLVKKVKKHENTLIKKLCDDDNNVTI